MAMDGGDVEGEGRKYPPQKHLFRKKDIHLKDELRKEKEGILAWLVQGCLEWQEHGLLPPDVVTDAVVALSKDEDKYGQWINECLITDNPNEETSFKEIFETFRWWWDDNMDGRENRTPSKIIVAKILTDRGYEQIVKGDGKYRRGISIGMEIADRVATWQRAKT